MHNVTRSADETGLFEPFHTQERGLATKKDGIQEKASRLSDLAGG